MGQLKNTSKSLVPVNHCRNCKKILRPEQAFCDSCGAKRIQNRLTAKNLLEDFNERYLNIENSMLRTFLALFTNPEAVIDGYIHGVRKKYLSAFGYFGIAITLAGLYVYIFNTFLADDLFSEFAQVEETPEAEMMMASIKNMMDTINDYQAVTSFLIIPLLAAITRLLFVDFNKYNYIEHLVIFLYVFSQYSIINSVVLILLTPFTVASVVISGLIQVVAIVYAAYVFKRLYELSAGQTILRVFIFLMISPIFFGIIILIVGIVGYWLGWFDGLI
ncbi:MAG: DUF3667 domain-containing protein [Leeuwenhoekiella sp.]